MRYIPFVCCHLWLLCSLLSASEEPLEQRSHSSYSVLGSTTSGDLDAKLLDWWGSAKYAIYERNVEHDERNAGFELSTTVNHTITQVMSKVLARHLSGKPCISLPVNVSLHAWRYNQDSLESCLNNLSADAREGSSCTITCHDFSTLSTTLVCSKTESGWRLLGDAAENQCRWIMDSRVRNTTGGLVQGLLRPMSWKLADGQVQSGLVRTFWGIPYAERPARFAMARPLSSRWSGVQLIDYYNVDRNDSQRMHCLDGAPGDVFHGSEDCLFVDVHTPPNVSASLMPVLVWIFGAGFFMGDGWQNGHMDLASLAFRQGVVVVQISSRTAAMGHWAHPALSREYGDGSVGNIGARDQRMALRWVRENIEAFGGDPMRVTLAGHSSGAFNTFFHLLSPGSQGLIHGAILESPAVDSGWYWQNKEQAYEFYAKYGAALGCPEDDGSGSQIACLRSLPGKAFTDFVNRQAGLLKDRLQNSSDIGSGGLWGMIEAAYTAVLRSFEPAGLQRGDKSILANPLWPLLCFGMIVDGSPAGLPAAPRDLYEKGAFADVPIYMNHEADEGTLFGAMAMPFFPWTKHVSLTNAAVDSVLKWAFNSNARESEDMLTLYPHTWLSIPLPRLNQAITDAVFKCPIRRFAHVAAKRHPGKFFWAEHTFIASHSKSTAMALLHKDAGWFLGAHHCLPSIELMGFKFAPGQVQWNDDLQKDHRIINCHFALMVHCGAPGATPGTAECLPELPPPLTCQGLLTDELRPFPSYDSSTDVRQQLHPRMHDPIVPSNDENEKCRFWDEASPMVLIKNNCRSCSTGQSVGSGNYTEDGMHHEVLV
eukprot:TRINITY_DN15970_c0_g1_i1.p1 TRINITY_DN15970_c0_g1~~TRINITY_DN15970_c0_g1_i1.p1  ORF type:complete len:836 (-),score=47.98 TRINITY_DN15970_c0_g1_i1:230-2695(-)